MAIFAYIGYERGVSKEIISTAGIILGIFAFYEFDNLLRNTLLAGFAPEQKFFIQCFLFGLLIYASYHTRAIIGGRGRGGRSPVQGKVIGMLFGLVNGYLIAGTIWYFLELNRIGGLGAPYPLDPYVTVPQVGSISAQWLSYLPLVILAPNGTDELLVLAVIVLFVIVLVVM